MIFNRLIYATFILSLFSISITGQDLGNIPNQYGEVLKNVEAETVKAKEPELLKNLNQNIRLIDEGTGLVSNRMEKILEDELGNLWFITRQGICKYNGLEFVNYLTEFEFKSGAKDQQGNLWFGTYKQGLIKYDGIDFILFDERNGFTNTNIRNIKPGDDKGVFILHDEGFSWTTNKGFEHYALKINNRPTPVNDITQVDSNFLLIATDTRGVVRILNGQVKCFNDFKVKRNEKENKFALNKVILTLDLSLINNFVWITSRKHGVMKVPLSEFRKDNIPDDITKYSSGHARRIYPVDDAVWSLTNKGPMLIKNDQVIDSVNSAKDFDTYVFSDVHVDSSGITWFATKYGVIAYDNGPFKYYRYDVQNKGDYRYVKYVNGALFFSKNHRLYKTDTEFKKVSLHLDYERGNLRDMLIDKDNNIWAGIWGNGLFTTKKIKNIKSFYGEDSEYKTNDQGLKYINLLLYPKKNGLNFSTNKFPSKLQIHNDKVFEAAHGLYEFNEDTLIIYTSKDGLLEPECNALSSVNGELWVGTQEGLYILKNNDFTQLDDFKGLTISKLYVDSDQNLWVAIGMKKLVVIDTKSHRIIKTYSKENGLKNLNIRSIVEDRKEQIWIGTSKGVYRISKNCNSASCIKYFDQYNGFISMNCQENAVSIDDAGNIWWAVKDRLIQYNHKDDFELEVRPKTYLKNVKLSSTNKNWQEFINIYEEVEIDSIIRWTGIPHSVSLPYDKNSFSISYASIDWRNIGKIKYQFKLKGTDQGWSGLNDNTTITLTELKAGDYEFIVRATNNEGLTYGDAVSFKFSIRKPYWQTNWFYAIISITLLSLIYLIIKSRERSLKVRQAELELKVSERTDELKEEKELVEKQKKEIEKKNSSITESINYAKRIQEAILPGDSIVKKSLPESFVFYKPKDIVSGDFYWIFDAGDRVLFSAVDCTGHGVPGALMSIIGHSMLEKVVKEYGLLKPSLILNALSKELARTLNPNQLENKHDDIKDGMDLAICSIFKNGDKVEFAGAYNPLYIVRNQEILEIKSDRLQIGRLNYTKGESFSNKELKLEKNDVLYIFSDGFVDQKGGPKKKKFYYQPFRELLIEIHKLPMQEQKVKLQEQILNWKGDLEQTDDICIIGVRV